MAWSHLDTSSVHLTYLTFGIFTTIFTLSSAFIKERLYLGEANVAFIVGIICGPQAANALNPMRWGDSQQVIVECTRVVLVIQCFTVGVELPKHYIKRHWRDILSLLVPVMIWGWLISSLIIWVMVRSLTWKDSLAYAACFNAIDPVLAAIVVGNGKFARRVPVHLRRMLLAESACNGLTTSLALGLSTPILLYEGSSSKILYRFLILTTLYEVIFGAFVGAAIGVLAHLSMRIAEQRGMIDRSSFLSFYLVLSLFCTGVGSMLGVDEVLLGFCAGYAFDRQDWFQVKTEESHISAVVNLLLNMSFFVLLGAIVPWKSYSAPALFMIPWRLIIGTLLLFLFRRIPVVFLMKQVMNDIKTYREALFYGHFGPIGAGAIFSAFLIKAQLDTGGSRQFGSLPSDSPFHVMSSSLFPTISFVVVCSTIVHGSSVPLWMFGRFINTLGFVRADSTASTDSGRRRSWMDRLPRIEKKSSSRSSMACIPPEASLLLRQLYRLDSVTSSQSRHSDSLQRSEPRNDVVSTLESGRRQHANIELSGWGSFEPTIISERARLHRCEHFGRPIPQSAIAPARRNVHHRPIIVEGTDELPHAGPFHTVPAITVTAPAKPSSRDWSEIEQNCVESKDNLSRQDSPICFPKRSTVLGEASTASNQDVELNAITQPATCLLTIPPWTRSRSPAIEDSLGKSRGQPTSSLGPPPELDDSATAEVPSSMSRVFSFEPKAQAATQSNPVSGMPERPAKNPERSFISLAKLPGLNGHWELSAEDLSRLDIGSSKVQHLQTMDRP